MYILYCICYLVFSLRDLHASMLGEREAFLLYDTHGFPLDLTEQMAQEASTCYGLHVCHLLALYNKIPGENTLSVQASGIHLLLVR